MARGAPGEHAQQQDGQLWRIDQRKRQDERVEEVRTEECEVESGARYAGGQQKSAQRGPASCRKKAPVACVLVGEGLVKIAGHDRAEGGCAGGQAAHQAGQQRRERKAQKPGG